MPLCSLCYYLKQKPPIIKSPFFAAIDETEREKIVHLLTYTDSQRINQNSEEAVPSYGVRRDVIFRFVLQAEKADKGIIGNSVALQ